MEVFHCKALLNITRFATKVFTKEGYGEKESMGSCLIKRLIPSNSYRKYCVLFTPLESLPVQCNLDLP